MDSVMPYMITVLLVALGLIWNRSKVLSWFQILWMWALTAFNTGGADWDVHQWYYWGAQQKIEIFSAGWGYKYICLIFSKLGLDFYQMNFVLSTLMLCIVFWFIHKYTERAAFVLSLFMIFPFTDFIIQKRNSLGMIILYLAFTALFSEKKSKGRTAYCLICLLATAIHPVYVIYIPLAFMENVPREKIKKIVGVFLIVAFALIPVLPRIAGIFMGEVKVNTYFQVLRISLFESICWWILQIAFCILFFVIMENRLEKETLKFQKVDFIIKINMVSLLVLPLYYYEPTFFRIYRNLFLLNYVAVANCMTVNKRISKMGFMGLLALSLLILLTFLSQFVWFGLGFDVLVKPLIENNKFLEMF